MAGLGCSNWRNPGQVKCTFMRYCIASLPFMEIPNDLRIKLLEPSAPIKYLHSSSTDEYCVAGSRDIAETVTPSFEFAQCVTLYPFRYRELELCIVLSTWARIICSTLFCAKCATLLGVLDQKARGVFVKWLTL